MKDVPETKYAQLQDTGIRDFLIAGELFYPPEAINFTVAQQRLYYDSYCAHFRKSRPFGVGIEDFQLGSIACRRYTPQAANATKLLYLHGGGFVVGGLESHDDICAELAAGTDLETVAVQYRLAPENPFPAALEDCWTVLQHMTAGGLPVIVAGDSAGGNLAAALCLKAQGLKLREAIKGQVLIYPGLGGDTTKGSYLTQVSAPGLSTADVLYYRDIYQGHGHPFAEPLKAESHVGLPPAFLVAAALDPLSDDCEAYASKLKACGVAAEVRHEPDLVHAFLRARHMSIAAARSFAEIIAAIRRFAA